MALDTTSWRSEAMYQFNRLVATCVQPAAIRLRRPQQWPELARSADRTTDGSEAAPTQAIHRRSDQSRTPSARA